MRGRGVEVSKTLFLYHGIKNIFDEEMISQDTIGTLQEENHEDGI